MALQIIKSLQPEVVENTDGIKSNTTKLFGTAAQGAGDFIADFNTKISPTGDFTKLIGTNALINSIRTLLITPVGSYPFDPAFGSNLFKKVFEPSDQETVEEIKFETIEKIKTYDPRINILDVESQFYADGKGFRLNLTIERGGNRVSTNIDFGDEIGFALEEG